LLNSRRAGRRRPNTGQRGSKSDEKCNRREIGYIIVGSRIRTYRRGSDLYTHFPLVLALGPSHKRRHAN
jgi:hypothetical protein